MGWSVSLDSTGRDKYTNVLYDAVCIPCSDADDELPVVGVHESLSHRAFEVPLLCDAVCGTYMGIRQVEDRIEDIG